MDLQLTGQVAVVEGADGGIGRAIAAAFAAEGAGVALLDRDPEVAGAARGLRDAAGGRSHAWAVDVTDLEAVRRAAGEVEGLFGRLDHVVYAVAVGSGKYG